MLELIGFEQRCKNRNIDCVETEERQQQERRASVAHDASHRDSFDDSTTITDSTLMLPQPRRESVKDVSMASAEAPMNEGLMDMAGLGANGGSGSMDFEAVFPEFFEHIMMPFAGPGTNNPIARPPDVSNYTQDFNFGAADIDFSFLDNPAAWTPMPLPDVQWDTQETQSKTGRTPNSEAGPRSEALKRSPWSWNSWIPPRGVGAFSEHTELNVREDRVNAADQLTSPSARQISHCSLDQSNRDQMIRIVTQCTVHKLYV